jgi:hypothetical protein
LISRKKSWRTTRSLAPPKRERTPARKPGFSRFRENGRHSVQIPPFCDRARAETPPGGAPTETARERPTPKSGGGDRPLPEESPQSAKPVTRPGRSPHVSTAEAGSRDQGTCGAECAGKCSRVKPRTSENGAGWQSQKRDQPRSSGDERTPTLRSIPMSLGARSCRGWRLCHSEKSWPLQAAPNPVPPRIGRVGAFLIRCFGQLSPHSRRERKLASSPLVAWISGFDLTATSTSGMPYRGRP